MASSSSCHYGGERGKGTIAVVKRHGGSARKMVARYDGNVEPVVISKMEKEIIEG